MYILRMAADSVVARRTWMVSKSSGVNVRSGAGRVRVVRVSLHVAGVGASHRVDAQWVRMAMVDRTVGGARWMVVKPMIVGWMGVVPPTMAVGPVVVVVKLVRWVVVVGLTR